METAMPIKPSPTSPHRHRHGWTPERRARQALAIRRWKPWDRSTGPRTEQGKRTVSRNLDARRIDGTARAIREILKMAAALRRRALAQVRIAEHIIREKNRLVKLMALVNTHEKQLLIGQWLVLDRCQPSILRFNGLQPEAPVRQSPRNPPLSFALPCVMKNP
jgi:hypothetical protein